MKYIFVGKIDCNNLLLPVAFWLVKEGLYSVVKLRLGQLLAGWLERFHRASGFD
jgi:hypothetical protein